MKMYCIIYLLSHVNMFTKLKYNDINQLVV